MIEQTRKQNINATIKVGENSAAYFNGDISENGEVNISLNVNDPQTFYSSTEGIENLKSLIDQVSEISQRSLVKTDR
ncbi:hypothetical protein V6B05_10860 [Lactococcus garvieae]|uniref:hypothetical protein n=1 Tax=Lactococcus garvieae TaxID=1363 RepID=UPI001F60DAC2|nr:hypothetical protein [Lactococcus garvieae]MCI3861561.1 hypothetical protein [Lactococcus garvieae]